MGVTLKPIKKVLQQLSSLRMHLKHAAAWVMRVVTLKRAAIVGATLVAVLVVVYTAAFFWPRAVAFSYSQPNCFFNPVALPATVSVAHSESFNVELEDTFTIGGFTPFSLTTCVTLLNPPKADETETIALKPLNLGWPAKQIAVTAASPPAVNALVKPDKPISTKDPLLFELEGADSVFSYKLAANKKEVECQKSEQEIACELASLKLKQAAKYTFTLERIFNQTPTETVFSKNFITVEPIQILNATVGAGQTIYNKPDKIAFALSKPIASLEDVLVERVADGKRTAIPHETTHKDKDLIVTFKEELPRQANIELRITQITAKDNGYLSAPYILAFTTSGGPKVQHIGIGSYKVPPGSGFVLGFDSELSADQDLQKFIKIEAGGAVASAITAHGTSISITPAALPPCTPFTVKVLDGLQNKWGVKGGSAWQFSSRTLCQTVFGIGTSVQGRGILAYRFGTGPSRMVFVGGIHGHEKSSVYTLNSLIEALEANPSLLPAHRTLTIIPSANPDGYAAHTRMNARNVDLNRNFPANDWKAHVTIPGGTYPTGGGTAPLSEPESQALASYIGGQGARLVMSYHAIAPLVAANEVGDSFGLAQIYGQKTGLPAYGNDSGGAFHYDTTGALENWLRDKRGTPAILVELSTFGLNEFSRHHDAMITMLQIP